MKYLVFQSFRQITYPFKITLYYYIIKMDKMQSTYITNFILNTKNGQLELDFEEYPHSYITMFNSEFEHIALSAISICFDGNK